MGVYQYNMDDADAHWSLLGSALKVRARSFESQLVLIVHGCRLRKTWACHDSVRRVSCDLPGGQMLGRTSADGRRAGGSGGTWSD